MHKLKTVPVLIIVLIIASGGVSISRLAAAADIPILPNVRITGHLTGTCVEKEIGMAFSCGGLFNGVIDKSPAEGDFHLSIYPTSNPGPLPNTMGVAGEFHLMSPNSSVPILDVPVQGFLRGQVPLVSLRLNFQSDLDPDLEIFASIFLRDDDGGPHWFEGTVLYGD